MKAKLYNQTGTVVGEVDLPAAVFGLKVAPEFVHDVVLAIRANARVAIAHTKNRGEVRGGGKKPWRQKGTGRARHGSIRSPIWIGGGVTHGPRNDRSWSIKINRKARQKAVRMILSDKAAAGRVLVLETLTLGAPKTKELALIIKKLPVGKRTLLVLPKSDPDVLRASRNLPDVLTVTANALPVLELMRRDTLVLPQETVGALTKLFAGEAKATK